MSKTAVVILNVTEHAAAMTPPRLNLVDVLARSSTHASTAVRGGWDELVREADELGYRVELVEYCESADSPGLLGAGLGVCIYAKRIIRVRRALREEDRCFVLEHELDHARNAGAGREWHAELDRKVHVDHADQHRVIDDYLYPEM
jgi:hypothetical protein